MTEKKTMLIEDDEIYVLLALFLSGVEDVHVVQDALNEAQWALAKSMLRRARDLVEGTTAS